MANAVNTNSTISNPDGSNKTSTSLSTNILILVNNIPVGAVQSLSITEQRTIKKIQEIGTDGVVDSAPNQSVMVSGSCNRIRFDRLRISEAFGRGFLHAASQIYPFDIVIMDRQKQDVSVQISTVIKNVWIEQLNVNYQVNDWVIAETMNWQAETIYSFINGGNAAAVGGELGIKHATFNTSVPNIEQVVDTGSGGRRGTMDSSGILDLALTSSPLF
jgi:hypothetical protein